MRWFLSAGVLGLCVCFVHCGGEAALGEECDGSGDDDNCEDGTICTLHETGDDEPTCVKKCETDEQCSGSEKCVHVIGDDRGCAIRHSEIETEDNWGGGVAKSGANTGCAK